MGRNWVAVGVGLLAIAAYIAVLGILDSTRNYVNSDKALGWGVAVFAAAAAGARLMLQFWHHRDGPR